MQKDHTQAATINKAVHDRDAAFCGGACPFSSEGDGDIVVGAGKARSPILRYGSILMEVTLQQGQSIEDRTIKASQNHAIGGKYISEHGTKIEPIL